MFFSSEKTSYLLEALAKGRNMKLIASNIRIQNRTKTLKYHNNIMFHQKHYTISISYDTIV